MRVPSGIEDHTVAATGAEGAGSYLERSTVVDVDKETAERASRAVSMVEVMAEVVSVAEAME